MLSSQAELRECEGCRKPLSLPNGYERPESGVRVDDNKQQEETPMYAVVVAVTIHEHEASERHLREQVVPGVSKAPGFIAGYWTRKDDSGMAMVVFESEEAATGMSERVPSMLPADVTLESVEVREVVVHA